MEIKMASQEGDNATAPSPTCMESVNRISKLPVVESTIQTATSLYSKVKDYNDLIHWTLSTTENAVYKVVEVGKPIATPVVKNLEGPIKRVDDILCSGLDYVETKVPAVKLPASEIILQVYTTTKDFVNSKVETARSYVEPTVKYTLEKAEPAIQSAKNLAEPYVQPVLEGAQALKEYGTHKVEEFCSQHNHKEGEDVECKDCKKAKSS